MENSPSLVIDFPVPKVQDLWSAITAAKARA